MTPPRGQRRRRVTANAVRRELLVFVEGKVTEEEYLNHYHRRHRRDVRVHIDDFRGVPLSLVRRAIDAKKKSERDARRKRGRAYDEIWCVFDVDRHSDLKGALSLAREHGINVAVSNPCVELWFLLHFSDQTAYIERHDAQAAAKAHTKCKKSLSPEALTDLEERYEEAKARALALDKKHHGDAKPFPENNPSSGAWRIIDSITSVADSP